MVKEFLTYHMVSLQSKVIFYCLYWKGNLSIKMQKKKKSLENTKATQIHYNLLFTTTKKFDNRHVFSWLTIFLIMTISNFYAFSFEIFF